MIEKSAPSRSSRWNPAKYGKNMPAFADLGDHHSTTYASTPAPDVPVLEMTLSLLG